MRLFRRRKETPPEPLTLEQAIEQGVVPRPPVIVTKRGFWVRVWKMRQNQLGQWELYDAEDIWWPSWVIWRKHYTSLYLGGPGAVDFRDVRSPIREATLFTGQGSTDSEQRVAKSLLIDSGAAEPAYDLERELQ